MQKRNLLTRIRIHYQKRGFLRTFRKMCEHPFQVIFKSKRLLIYAELNEVNDSVLTLPTNIIIECRTTYNEAVHPDMQRIIDYWDREMMMDKARERFEKGAILWIVKLNDDIAGFVWTIRGKSISPWYLPLTPHDAYVLDAVTFEEYRGRRLYPLIMNYVLGKLKSEGVSRALGELYAWNTPSIRGLERTYYRKFGEARRFHLLNRNITIWSQR